jgi:hypothetical protein
MKFRKNTFIDVEQPKVFLFGLANALNNQSACLAGLERPEEAWAALEEAMDIYTRMGEEWPEVVLENQFWQGLNRMMNNLASHMDQLGGPPEEKAADSRDGHRAPPATGGRAARCVSARPRRIAVHPVSAPR